MGVEFGGKRARKTGVYKGFAFSLQYVNHEPAMILRKLADLGPLTSWRNAAVVICLSALHRYRTDNDEHLRENWPSIEGAARAIGVDPVSRFELRCFLDCIEHLTEELGQMKPEPLAFQPRPDVDARVSGGKKAEIIGEILVPGGLH